MINKKIAFILIAFSASFQALAQNGPPNLTTEANTQLKGKKLEVIKESAYDKDKKIEPSEQKLPTAMPADTQQAAQVLSNPPIVDSSLASEMEAIRNLMEVFSKSLNKKEIDKTIGALSEQFLFINSNQKILRNKKDIDDYFQNKNKNSLVKLSSIELAEELVVNLSKNNDQAYITGKGVEKYLIGEKSFVVPVQWGANLKKECS